jgi:uncharacterized protein (TIGR03437 family)
MKILKTVPGMLLAFLIAPAIAPAQQYVISTIAGSGIQGYFGDTGQALGAGLDMPTRIAVDSKGNYYIVDYLSYIIREVDSTGVITTIAGNGTSGFLGDTLPALQGEISDVHGIAVDSTGNVYLADTNNSRIRKIDTSGNLSTIAGNGTFGYTGDGAAATSAELARPGAIAIDSTGNLYVPDYAASVVRKIDTSGKITTFAGTGTFGNSGDGGPANKATFAAPVAVAVDAAGNVYISDSTNGNIRKVTTDGNIRTVATSVDAQSLVVDSAGNIFYPDYLTNTIKKILTSGVQLAVAGNGTAGYSGDGLPANNAELNLPYGIAMDSSGKIYVADSQNQVIRLLTPISSSVGIVNAASNVGGGVSPGEIVVLYGTGIGPATLTTNTPVKGVYGTNVAGTTVSFDGNPAAILYASATQVAAIVPYEEALWVTAQFTISYQGNTLSGSIPVFRAAPGVFTANGTGTGPAAAVNQNGTVNSPSNPARVGSIISLFATGEGYPTPPGTDGQIAPNPAPVPINTVTATINGQPAVVTYAGGSPGSVEGFLQVNVQIPQVPASALAGGPISVPVALQIFGVPSQTGVIISVSN